MQISGYGVKGYGCVVQGGLTKSVMEAKNSHRYMTRKDIKAMFTLGDVR